VTRTQDGGKIGLAESESYKRLDALRAGKVPAEMRELEAFLLRKVGQDKPRSWNIDGIRYACAVLRWRQLLVGADRVIPILRTVVGQWFTEDRAAHQHEEWLGSYTPHSPLNVCYVMLDAAEGRPELAWLREECLDILARQYRLREVLGTPSGLVVSPRARAFGKSRTCTPADDWFAVVSGVAAHPRKGQLKTRHYEWLRSASILSPECCRIVVRRSAVVDVRLRDEIILEQGREGHRAWAPVIHCYNAPQWGAAVNYRTGQTEYVFKLGIGGGYMPADTLDKLATVPIGEVIERLSIGPAGVRSLQ
jgi:hypothetical protein